MWFMYWGRINGMFYKRKSVRYIFSYLISMLKDEYDFKVDKDTVDGSRYLTGMIKDYFVSIYLYSVRNDDKLKYYAWYKIVAFGCFGDERLDNKIIMKKQLFQKSERYYSSRDIFKEILWEVDNFDITNYYI
jgi:hypothetical protein